MGEVVLSGTAGMIVKMTAITLLYVAVSYLLWKAVKDRELNNQDKIAIGCLYGILCIFSTHYGVDYIKMMLNVRDLGPMAAGLFFSPASGIIAGIIGGAERYIAGTYLGVGEYSRIACSISTCLAGFLAAFMNIYIFKGKKPSVAYAFFMGTVIEVFHMYTVFLTHRNDMESAFYVVKVSAAPMILFSGFGLALISMVIKIKCGEWHNPLKPIPKEKVPVSERFQVWLFGVTASVLVINFGFIFDMQTVTAMQDAKTDLVSISHDIQTSVTWIYEHGGNTKNYSHYVWLTGTFLVLNENGEVIAGSQYDKYYNDDIKNLIDTHEPRVFFKAKLYSDEESLCLIRKPSNGLTIFTQIPMEEVFYNRDIQAYEVVFADILLFTVIYVLISLLVQGMVVDNLLRVNKSLNKITDGDLNEKVDVYNSSEFASLSDDINITVDVLKGYIDAAEKRIEQELQLAHSIQDSALLKNFTFTHQGFELYATMNPAKVVGGDFYDFFFVDTDKVAIVIADVSGKGIPAALLMMRAKTTIRSLAESGNDISVVAEKANRELCEGNELNMFVTAWMAIMDLNTGDMKCINAGHEYPAVKHTGGEFEILKDKHRPPLGAVEDMVYEPYELHLDPGDCVYVYTDGIPEAINTEEEQFGEERMLTSLNANKYLPMEGLLYSVKYDLDLFVGEADQFDDVTMLGFRYNGPQ